MKKRITFLLAVVMILTTLVTVTTVRVTADAPTRVVLTFDEDGTYDSAQTGQATLSDGEYLFSVNQYQWMKFNSVALTSDYHTGYYRILYQISGDTTGSNSIMLMNGGGGSINTFSDLKNTTAYELTPSTQLSSDIVGRFNKGGASIGIKYLTGNGTLKVKAIYFFTTKAEADQLSPAVVGYQTTLAYTDDAKLVRNLRFVAKGWDADQYQKVGFTISYEGMAGDPWDKNSTKVFESLTGQMSDGRTTATYTASSFGADYLYALAIMKAPTGANIFNITPYAVTLDGTRINGTTVVCNVAVSNVALTFGENGNEGESGTAWNSSAYKLGDGYNLDNGGHIATCFASSAMLPSEYRTCFRVLYSLSGGGGNSLKVWKGNGAEVTTFASLADTSGAYTLSPTYSTSDADFYSRITSGTRMFFTNTGSGTMRIKGIYFFTSSTDAAAFTVPSISESMLTMTFGSEGNANGTPSGISGGSSANISFKKHASITAYHKYARLVYCIDGTDSSANSVTFTSTGNGNIKFTLSGLSQTDGYVLSDTIDLTNAGEGSLMDRLYRGGYNTNVAYSGTGTFTLRNIHFFTSQAEADAYALPEKTVVGLTFGLDGTANPTVTGNTSGAKLKGADNSYVLSYSSSAFSGMNYYFLPLFASQNQISTDHQYVRVLYRYSGADSSIKIVSHSDGTSLLIPATNTGGEFMLTDVETIPGALISRFREIKNNSIGFINSNDGVTCEIKGIYFFESEEEAEFFVPEFATSTVTINNHALSDYKIIIPENAVKREAEAAELLQNYFGMVSGVELPIAVDTETAVGTYEILVGYTNRSESVSAYASYLNGGTPKSDYSVKSVGNKLVFATYYNFTLDQLVPAFISEYHLNEGSSTRPSSINIAGCDLDGSMDAWSTYTWSDAGSPNTQLLNDSFSIESNGADAQNWCEEGTIDQWKVQSGKYVSAGNGYELTYLHVYEKNASLQAELTPTAPSSGKGTFGLQLRYTSEYGYVRGGYDYAAGCWYIEYREGEDFSAFRIGTSSATLTNGTTYTVKLQVVNGTATLYVNGVEIIGGTVGHLSPGRIAIYDNDVSVKADNVTVYTTGSGKILTDITHTVLPDETYREGGTVIQLNDGNLHYIHYSGDAFVSSDDGKTWEKESSWYSGSYPSVLRLQNGNLLKSVYENGYSCMYTSTDDGKTWTFTGNVCKTPHEDAVSDSGEHILRAGNMNDKLTQISSGRIFFVQNYESSNYSYIDGRTVVVCCEIFYSDNNGATWTKSPTATYNMSGNTDWYRNGEGKIIECSDGSLRFLCSWNQYDCIFYSESTDNGATWGSLQKMTQFKCGKSSMAIVRDPNGPTAYTYYMVWCYDSINDEGGPESLSGMPRSRLALAYSTDGKNWKYLGDIWCWESGYTRGTALLNHIVDPFIYVTEDAVIIGSGISEKAATNGEASIAFSMHQAQRQHIWRIEKSSLTAYQSWPSVRTHS